MDKVIITTEMIEKAGLSDLFIELAKRAAEKQLGRNKA